MTSPYFRTSRVTNSEKLHGIYDFNVCNCGFCDINFSNLVLVNGNGLTEIEEVERSNVDVSVIKELLTECHKGYPSKREKRPNGTWPDERRND